MKHRRLFSTLLIIVALAVLSSIPLLASGCPTNSVTTATTKTTGTGTLTTTGGGQTTTTTGGGGQTTTTTGGGGQTTATTSTTSPGGIPNIADMKSLSSYRYTIKTTMIEGPGAGQTDYMHYEYVKAQQATHAWLTDATGKVTEVYIEINGKFWAWFGQLGMGWVEQPQQPTTTPAVNSDLAAQLKKAQEDMQASQMRFVKVGTETVNNVSCDKYEFEYSLTVDMPNVMTGKTTKTDMHSIGTMWLSNQSGMVNYAIRSITKTEITGDGDKMVMESQQDLTDIGAAITISPPTDAFVPPTGTTTGLPTSTTTTNTGTTSTTTTTTPGGTVILSDDFQGSWNSAWTWTDPMNDATYDFTTHSGFLHLTVPDGNDLAGSNFDAPRLMVAQNGDFAIETRIEFNPQEEYLGAGILIWQNEDNFIRLEFGYGGIGGLGKNVVFCSRSPEWGDLGYIGSADLPSGQTSIELRMQRVGNQFTASYRPVGGTWQEIGSGEISLASTVDIGISEITIYTSTVKSADFDYVKITQP